MKKLLCHATLLLACLSFAFIACKSPTATQKNTNTGIPSNVHIKMTTDSGIVVLRLYDETPLHRDNFIRLVRTGFYDSLLFHRVIPEFMIQGGDPDSKFAAPGNMLGSGGEAIPRVPAEIKPNLYNKRGALCAARDDNPKMESSGCQFYIVTGKKFTDAELDKVEQRSNKKMSAEERNIYKTEGGSPWLDGKYTVYGEVVSGIEVVEKISKMKRDANDRPRTDIRMKMEIMRK